MGAITPGLPKKHGNPGLLCMTPLASSPNPNLAIIQNVFLKPDPCQISFIELLPILFVRIVKSPRRESNGFHPSTSSSLLTLDPKRVHIFIAQGKRSATLSHGNTKHFLTLKGSHKNCATSYQRCPVKNVRHNTSRQHPG